MNISRLGEFGLIDRIAKLVPVSKQVIKGIGDDAAVLPYTKSKYLLLTTDMLVEGEHFTRRTPPQAVGHKALARNISDIAAMGGLPRHALVAIALPQTTSLRFVREIYQGISALARQFGVSIVGGDTTKADKVTISIALLGEVEKKYLTTRDGAKPRDWILVSGPLGGSLASGRHLSFTPRVEIARFLVKQFKPSAMMDISDGLAGDLNHILKASRVGARLVDQAIPRHKGVSLKQALSDGEDFDLLFTLSPSKARRLMAWQAKQGNPSLRSQTPKQSGSAGYFYPIGEITADARERIQVKGYTHF